MQPITTYRANACKYKRAHVEDTAEDTGLKNHPCISTAQGGHGTAISGACTSILPPIKKNRVDSKPTRDVSSAQNVKGRYTIELTGKAQKENVLCHTSRETSSQMPSKSRVIPVKLERCVQSPTLRSRLKRRACSLSRESSVYIETDCCSETQSPFSMPAPFPLAITSSRYDRDTPYDAMAAVVWHSFSVAWKAFARLNSYAHDAASNKMKRIVMLRLAAMQAIFDLAIDSGKVDVTKNGRERNPSWFTCRSLEDFDRFIHEFNGSSVEDDGAIRGTQALELGATQKTESSYEIQPFPENH